MVPKVREIQDGFDVEPFSEYVKRWPKELQNFPEAVIEDWAYRHNSQFRSTWGGCNLESFTFQASLFSNQEVLAIEHLDEEQEHWEYHGHQALDNPDQYGRLAQYMRENGTFPVPIIVAKNAGHMQHPRGRRGEHMKDPLQLIEGHRRWGLIRAMILRSWPTLRSQHQVWVMRVGT